jgi:hypothetical protein
LAIGDGLPEFGNAQPASSSPPDCHTRSVDVKTESWLVPGDEVAFLFIDAQTMEQARSIGMRAAVPFEGVVEARASCALRRLKALPPAIVRASSA